MEFLSQLAGVAAVLALLGATLWLLRRRGLVASRHRGSMERIERLALTPQHSLFRVRAGERELLIAVHPAGCTLLESGPARGEAK